MVTGHCYWYLVQKGRKNGVVTNIKTIYIGSADRLSQMLSEAGESSFPAVFDSKCVTARTLLLRSKR